MAGAAAIVVFEAAHLFRLRREYPAEAGRIFLLPLFEPERVRPRGFLRYTIVDPYGKSLDVFEHCYQRIAVALGGLFESAFGGTRWR
jgi:protein-tyrosine-phosphatase